jgi:hypothetical protein
MTTETDDTEMDGSSMNVDEAKSLLPDHKHRVPTSAETNNAVGSTFQSYEISRNPLEQQLFAAVLENFDVDSQQHQQPSPHDATARIVDLESVLCGLKLADDVFFPSKIYVRICMKTILGRFYKDRLSENSNRVLLGSPGVGKSVLFFIAALEKSLNGDKPVVYIRKTKEEHLVSIFVMIRVFNGVRVFSCRSVRKYIYRGLGLGQMRTKVAVLFGLGDERNCVLFLDGPRHGEETDLEADYDYFCTSGGHPLPKNAQEKLFLWVLDGWSWNDVSAYGKMVGCESDYLEAYYHVGGCIRDIVKYVRTTTDRERICSLLEGLVERVASSQIDLVLTTTSRSNNDDSGNPDRLRMMFNGKSRAENIPAAVQIVDSQFVARLLRGRQTFDSFHFALLKGKAIQSGTVVGIYFEEMLHQWFKDQVRAPRLGGVSEVHQAQGSGRDGVKELTKVGMYWIPSISNFANIDAALVIGSTLYVFQYAKSYRHSFNVDSFWQDFVTVVNETVSFDRIHVFFVLMDGVATNLSVNFRRKLKLKSGTQSSSKLVSIACLSTQVNIDTTSIDTVRSCAQQAFPFSLSTSRRDSVTLRKPIS